MAKRFTKPVVNWAELEKMVPVEQKTKFMAFKTKSESYFQRVRSLPAEPPKIKWEEYKKTIDGQIVEKLKADYEKFKVPFPEDKLSVQIDKQWSELEPKIKAFCDEVQKDIDVAQKELNIIKAKPKFDDMTLEMFRDLYPKVAIDPVNKPSFWPHNPEEQPDYLTPEQIAAKQAKAAKKK